MGGMVGKDGRGERWEGGKVVREEQDLPGAHGELRKGRGVRGGRGERGREDGTGHLPMSPQSLGHSKTLKHTGECISTNSTISLLCSTCMCVVGGCVE